MLKKKVLIILLSIFYITNAFTSIKRNIIAEVAKVKGKVTKLSVGDIKASPVKLKEKLKADTSILTGDKSFVRIRFFDDTFFNLGPKSKFVVVQKRTKNKPGVINFLVGQIRAQIKDAPKGKDQKKKIKYIVNTKSASMGVRGTDFQLSFNPENKISTVVTFEGEVAVAKKADKVPLEEKLKDVTTEKLEETVFAESKTVAVKPGQVTTVVQKYEKATVPVKMSPKQFETLSANETMGGSEEIKEVAIKEAEKTISEAPAEGFVDTATGKVAPRAGGYVDLNTGIYVPPTSDSTFDSEKNVYVPKEEVGQIDSTGNYVPPEGMALDATKGFVVKDDSEEKVDEEKVKELQETLNESIKETIEEEEPENDDDEDQDESEIGDHDWDKRHHLSVEIGPTINYTLNYHHIPTGGTKHRVVKNNESYYQFNWQQNWTKTWSTYLNIGAYDLSDKHDSNKDEATFHRRGIGLLYKFTPNFMFDGELFKQDYPIFRSSFDPTVDSDGDLSNVEFGNIKFGMRYRFLTWEKIFLATNIGAIFVESKTHDGTKIEKGQGAYIKLRTAFNVFSWLNVEVGYYLEYINQNTEKFKGERKLQTAGIKLDLKI